MKRYKINYNRAKLTEEELRRDMDFSSLQKTAPPTFKIFNTIKAVKLIAMLAIPAVLIVAYFAREGSGKQESSYSPFIQPPVEKADVPAHTFQVNTAKDTVLIYKTGSTLHVPAGLFADQQGRPVAGNIQIRYREFHDPFEVLLSGIPMHYDSANSRYQFESAGMIEIEAFKGGEPLNIRPGRSLAVNLISHTTGDNYNIYYLDTVQRRWNYISDNTRSNNTVLPLYDSSMVKEYEKTLALVSEPVKPLRANPSNPSFIIDYKKEEFPELAIYGDLMFEVKAGDENYNPSLARRTWEDVSIQKEDKGFYKVTFSTETESHSFSVRPVVEGKHYEAAMKEYDQKMNEYQLALNKRRDKSSRRENIIRSNYEKYVAESRWDDVNSRISNLPVNYRYLAVRAFNITRTGLWNSDCPWPLSEMAEQEFAFSGPDHKPLQAVTVYVIEKERNFIFPCRVNENGRARIRYNKKGGCVLLSLTSEGYPAYLNEKDFKKFTSKSGTAECVMNIARKQITDAGELKKLFNL